MNQALYDLPEGWEWKRLDELFEIARGGSPRPIKDFITTDDNGINWIKIGDTTVGGRYIYSTEEKIKPEGLKKSRLVVEGDFILSNSMSFGRPYIMKTKGCIHDGWLLLHPIYEQLDKEYVYYALSSPYVYKQFQNSAAGATVKNLNSDLVRQVQIPLPPLAEQTRIVEKLDAVLSRIDTAIDELQQSLALVDAMFKSGLDKAFNPLGSPTNEASLYDLPDGWGWITLDDVTVDTANLSPEKKPETLWTYIDISAIDKDKFAIVEPKQILGKDAPSRAKKQIQQGDVLFATTRPNLKNIAIFELSVPNPVASTGFCVLRPAERIVGKFLFYFVTTDFVQQQIEPFISGASYPAVTDKNLKRVAIPLPPLVEQTRIVEKLDAFNDKTTQLKTELTAKIGMFNQLKASVLDGAFRGEV